MTDPSLDLKSTVLETTTLVSSEMESANPSKTCEYRLIKLLFVLGSSSVEMLEPFVNVNTSSCVFHEVPSAFNESDIFSGSVVGTRVSALS